MSYFVRLALSLVIASMTAVCAEQQFTISGTVVRTGSSQPLKKIRVIIAPVQNQSAAFEGQNVEPLSMVTAEDGRFVFTHLGAGKYMLAAQGRGFASQNYEQHGQFSTAIVTGPGLDSEHVVFPLSSGGSITGLVFDSEGDPVSNGQVWLLHRGMHTEVQSSAGTNSAGEFHFSHLTPGSYYVAVHASPWYAQSANLSQQVDGSSAKPTTSELDVTYPLTYYGDTTEAGTASLISVTEGGKVPVRITLRAVPSAHVAISGAQLSPEGGINANLFQFGPDGVQLFTGVQMNSFNGQHELTGIAPGRYALSLSSMQPGRSEPLTTQLLEVQGNTSIDVSNAPKNSLAGHAVFEGTSAPSRPFVVLSSVALGEAHTLAVKPDGTFSAGNETGPAIGRFFVVLVNAPGYYVKSVTAKGAEFSNGVLEIRPGATVDLSLIAAMGDGRIDGVALKNGNPLSGALIVGVPEDSNRSDLIRADQSDSDGTFTLPNLAPGRYTVVAIENGQELMYIDPAVIKPYLTQGEAFNVPASGKLKVKVNAATRLP